MEERWRHISANQVRKLATGFDAEATEHIHASIAIEGNALADTEGMT
jgi:hypothetical protein